jgi:hypothetical protein
VVRISKDKWLSIVVAILAVLMILLVYSIYDRKVRKIENTMAAPPDLH